MILFFYCLKGDPSMKSYSVCLSSIWSNIMLACSLWVLGCAQGGSGIATGDCAVATGGLATITVSPELHVSLGDSAIAAASRAVGLYLTKLPGPIGAIETKQATATALDAAEQAKGTPLTAAEKQELEDRARVAISTYKVQCGKL
jgi:hypothetical protein